MNPYPDPVMQVVFICIFIMLLFSVLSLESDQSAATSSLSSCRSLVFHFKMGKSRQVSFPTSQK